MRYQKTNERRAVILMVVLSLLTLFALVGVTFVLYADAEATAARVAREAQTASVADVNPQEALAFFLGQLIYDVPDNQAGVGSGLRGHSLARTMYGYQYPGRNVAPFNGVGRLHYASPLTYPATALTNVPANWGGQLDDYALVNYTWFSGDNFLRDPERYGFRTTAQLVANNQPNSYVGGNAPYTYPDLNNCFLAAMRADGTVLTPSYHRPWLFQVVNGKYYAFNDMTNPNWSINNPQGKYLTLRPRPAEHPSFPLPGDATGDVKNLTWAPGGNDSIWIDLGAPVMTAPDGTQYKMMFAPLVLDLDGRVNLNTAGNILAYVNAMAGSSTAANGAAAWQAASGAHVSNQGWGSWEVNLAKVLWGDQAAYPYPQTTPPTPTEWQRILMGSSYATTLPPNTLPIIAQAGAFSPTPLPASLSAWLLPGVPGRYLETPGAVPVWTPNAPPASVIPSYASAISLNATYQHAYAQSDMNGWNEAVSPAASSRPLPPGFPANAFPSDPAPNPAINPFASFQQGYNNGNLVGTATQVPPNQVPEAPNHPLLFNYFQSPLNASFGTRAFRAQDMEALLRPNVSANGPVSANGSAVSSDLLRLCPYNFAPYTTPAWSALTPVQQIAAMRYRNLVTTQSTDIGAPGVTPYWWQGMTTGYLATNIANSFLLPPVAAQPAQTTSTPPVTGFPPLPPNAIPPLPAGTTIYNGPGTIPITSEFGIDWRALSSLSGEYYPTTNPAGYVSPGARIRLNRPLPPYPHMGALSMPPYNSLPPGATPSPYGVSYNLTNAAILSQYLAAQNARQALANDIYRRLLAAAGLAAPANRASPTNVELAPRRWLAQLAVNIVDYIDEDDIMTPFNFYTTLDNNGLPLAPLANPSKGYPPAATPTPYPSGTYGPDDNDVTVGNSATTGTGANPDYWVFGTEMPKVVLNEVLAEAQQPNWTKANAGSESVKLWIELYNSMPTAATAGTNTQPQDQWRVPLYITNPAGGGYSPYRVSISQLTMEQANTPTSAPGTTPQLLDDSANVLGKAYVAAPFPQSTTDVDFTNPPTSPNSSLKLGNGGAYPPTGIGTNNVGVDASNYFLIGPSSNLGNYEDPFAANVPATIPVLRTDNVTYTPTWSNQPASAPNDERVTGVTVMLRRLANPYMPAQLNPTLPYYNPYVTVDYIPSVPIMQSQSTIASFGKKQPYGGYLKLTNTAAITNPLTVVQYSGGAASLEINANSPVNAQTTNAAPPAVPGAIVTNKVTNTFGYANWPLPQSSHYDWLVHLDRPPISPMELLHVSAWPPYKLTQKFVLGNDTVPASLFGHYAPWLDTPPLGTITIPGGTATAGSSTITMPNTTGLTVGAWVTVISNTTGERFSSTITAVTPNTNITLNGNWPNTTGAVTVTNLYYNMACPWWFDPFLPTGSPTSHRLYRLFEFLECGDRAFGVNGLGRIPGKVNINTIWDAETLQALIDANLSMGIAVNPSNTPLNLTTTPPEIVSQIFTNLMISRSPAYYNLGAYSNLGTLPYPVPIGPVNMGTGLDDRPFMPLSTGQHPGKSGGELQFPNGLSVITDTLLRTNNPFLNKSLAGNMLAYPSTPVPQSPTTPANQWLLFQNYNDGGAAIGGAAGNLTTSAVHPYLQTQLLTKLFNNVTTRSNTFAVFLTVGFFQVIPGGVVGHPNIPQLGPEIGRSEGKQIRHRMFAIVDRTNLTTFSTTGQGYAPPAAPPPVTGPTPNVTNPAPPAAYNSVGLQTIQLPLNVTGAVLPGPPPTPQLYVPNPIMGPLSTGVIQAGTQLVIDPGNVNEETVTVISVTPPPSPGLPATLTANFALPHGPLGATFPIVQRGNPGPWLVTPYDPRLDSNVVQYFSIIGQKSDLR
jgi:hypothetical protein